MYHGTTIIYYANGNIKKEVTFINDKIDGHIKSYFEDGQIKSVTPHKNNLPHGKYTHYYPNGCKMSEGTSSNGKMQGTLKIYYVCNMETTFSPADFERYQSYSNGGVEHEIYFKNGKVVHGFAYDERGVKSKMTNAHLHNMGFEL